MSIVWVAYEEEDLDVLRRLIGNSVFILDTKPQASRVSHVEDELRRVYTAMCNPIRDIAEFELIQDKDIKPEAFVKTPEVKRRRSTKGRAKQDKSHKTKYELCKNHPYYSAVRIPGTACADCWAAYKKLHPQEYKMKRAAWERKQGKAVAD